jgi:hypothetical protein
VLGLVDSLVRRVVRKGVRRGLAEGNLTWLALSAGAWLLRMLLRPEPAEVTREELRVGETIVVRHLPPPPTRRQRKRAARRALRAARRDGGARPVPLDLGELPSPGA